MSFLLLVKLFFSTNLSIVPLGLLKDFIVYFSMYFRHFLMSSTSFILTQFILFCQHFFKTFLKYFLLMFCRFWSYFSDLIYITIFRSGSQYFFIIFLNFFLGVHSKNNSNAKSTYNLCNYFFYFFIKSFFC